MNAHIRLFAAALCLLSPAGPAAAEPGDASLGIRVAPVVAAISPGPPGDRFIRLPELVYSFDLRADCPQDYAPQSVALNVADTRKSLDAARIAATGLRAVELHIPAQQIAPVALDGFCAAEPAAAGNPDAARVADAGRTMMLSDLLTLQVSLLCAGETDSSMTYASRALDVTLKCEPPPAEQTDIAL